jgi:hypothetical protein
LAAEVLEHIAAMLFPQVDEDFRIASGPELVPELLETLPLLGMVEQFAVVDHRDISLLIEDRLLTIFQTHNAQPAGRQTHARPYQLPTLVRTPVNDGLRHPFEFLGADLPRPRKVNNSSDTTHLEIQLG